MITSLTDDNDPPRRGRRLTAAKPIPGTSLADRVLIISARLARAKMFVDMDVIEAVLAADRQITSEEQGPQHGAATGERRVGIRVELGAPGEAAGQETPAARRARARAEEVERFLTP